MGWRIIDEVHVGQAGVVLIHLALRVLQQEKYLFDPKIENIENISMRAILFTVAFESFDLYLYEPG